MLLLPHLDTAARVALILGAALAAMPLLRGRTASARRLVLSLAFVASLLVAFVPARATTIHVRAPYHELAARVIAEPAVEEVASAPIATRSSGPSSCVDWLFLGWLAGALVVGARFALGFAIASFHARRARQTSQNVRISASIAAPAVAGVLSPVVLVPSEWHEWSAGRKQAVLLHEQTHIRAQDTRVQLIAAIVCGLHWFNPLAWLAARRLRLERELAADESVLRAGVRATSYAEDLLAIAASAPASAPMDGMIAMGDKPLERRIEAIVSAKRPRPIGEALLALGVSAATLAVACTDVAESHKPAVTAAPAEIAKAPAPATANDDLRTSVKTELERTVETWHADGGAILVLTPKGEILAEAGDPDRTIVAGSTMKPLLLAAAFDEDVVRESDVFENAPVGELLAKSNNPGFMRIFDRVGSEKLSRVLRGLHFAVPANLDAKTAIGATMTATPRQVALAYAALANGGNGVVSERTASRVSTLMESVVASAEGTGKKARIEGVRVAGKTGTSDWSADHAEHGYASFVGLVPAERPRFVIYVGIESARGANPWGSEVAAPVFARLAKQML